MNLRRSKSIKVRNNTFIFSRSECISRKGRKRDGEKKRKYSVGHILIMLFRCKLQHGRIVLIFLEIAMKVANVYHTWTVFNRFPPAARGYSPKIDTKVSFTT